MITSIQIILSNSLRLHCFPQLVIFYHFTLFRFLTVFVFITIVVSLLYLQYGRDVKVETGSLNCSSEFYEQKLNVIANKLFVSNKEKFAEKMIERCIDNTFHEVRFSYDITGYPNRIYISVYPNELSRKLGVNHFTILYRAGTESDYVYNVKDHPEMFKIKIETE